MWRIDLSAVAADVGVAHVVGHDYDDVGTIGSKRVEGGEEKYGSDERNESRHGGTFVGDLDTDKSSSNISCGGEPGGSSSLRSSLTHPTTYGPGSPEITTTASLELW